MQHDAQYTSVQPRRLLNEQGIARSMSQSEDARDDSAMESFLRKRNACNGRSIGRGSKPKPMCSG